MNADDAKTSGELVIRFSRRGYQPKPLLFSFESGEFRCQRYRIQALVFGSFALLYPFDLISLLHLFVFPSLVKIPYSSSYRASPAKV